MGDRGVRSPEAGVTGDCELPGVGADWELNGSLLPESQELSHFSSYLNSQSDGLLLWSGARQ